MKGRLRGGGAGPDPPEAESRREDRDPGPEVVHHGEEPEPHVVDRERLQGRIQCIHRRQSTRSSSVYVTHDEFRTIQRKAGNTAYELRPLLFLGCRWVWIGVRVGTGNIYGGSWGGGGDRM